MEESGEIDIRDCLFWLKNTEGFGSLDEVHTLISFVERHLESSDRYNAFHEAAQLADEQAKLFLERDEKGEYTNGGRLNLKGLGAAMVRDGILQMRDKEK